MQEHFSPEAESRSSAECGDRGAQKKAHGPAHHFSFGRLPRGSVAKAMGPVNTRGRSATAR